MLVFIFMTFMSASHLLLKALSVALLIRTSRMILFLYAGGDMTLYFIFKILRGDLRYWIRLDGLLGWLGTVMIRFVIKTIVDFTLIVQYRHPFDLGGSYWSINLLANQVFCFVVVHLYAKSQGEGNTRCYDKRTLESCIWLIRVLHVEFPRVSEVY